MQGFPQGIVKAWSRKSCPDPTTHPCPVVSCAPLRLSAYHPPVLQGHTRSPRLCPRALHSAILFTLAFCASRAPWGASGRGSLLLHHLVSKSAHPLTVCQIRYHTHLCMIVELGGSETEMPSSYLEYHESSRMRHLILAYPPKKNQTTSFTHHSRKRNTLNEACSNMGKRHMAFSTGPRARGPRHGGATGMPYTTLRVSEGTHTHTTGQQVKV